MIWPFKKKEEPKDYKPKWWNEWQELKGKFPIGHRFTYLGRTMIVVKHRNYRPGYKFISPTMPALICEYADKLGVLHEWIFPLGTWEVLIKG